MKDKVDVLAVMDDRIQMAAPMSVDDLREARAAVAELIEAADQVYNAWQDAEDWERLYTAIARARGE